MKSAISSATFSGTSSGKVRILPESLINKIAAGEVVERPASVVKELLENAIDAGATDLQVTVKNGGKDLISVLDNGCGMNETDAKLAVERHTTSKIVDEEDLFRIRTLGFRGEALASIAAVSHFEILTCDDESQGATRFFIKGGYFEQVGKTGFPQGTKITVERLFFNTPARLKFLKTTATELQHIQQHLVQKSLAHPHIHFRLTHNRQLLLNLTAGQTLEKRIHQLFGEEFRDILMPVQHEETYLKFSGFISFPSKPRTSRRWQYLFVNQRNIKSPAINHGIYDGYGTFLGKNQHPVFFLNLQVDPTEIDVNVHPAKTEIRFRNSRLVHTILADQLSRALKEGAGRRFFGREHPHPHSSRTSVSGQVELPMEDALPLENPPSGMAFLPQKFHRKSASTSRSLSQKHTQTHKQTQSGPYPEFHPTSPAVETDRSPAEISASISANVPENEVRNLRLLVPLPETPEQIRVLGQFRKMYIIAENESGPYSEPYAGSYSGLVIINQQLLHERLLHDVYLEAFQKKNVPPRTFQTPLLLELPPQEALLLEQYLEPLAQCGFAISSFSGNTFAVDTLPECLHEDQGVAVIREILSQLGLFGKRSRREEIFQDIWRAVASHGAMASEQKLTLPEMKLLLAQWKQSGSPLLSLQDGPLLFELSVQELEKRLGGKT